MQGGWIRKDVAANFAAKRKDKKFRIIFEVS